jgi:hypothetical protein
MHWLSLLARVDKSENSRQVFIMSIRAAGYGLSFISDENLYKETRELVRRINLAISATRIDKNSLDPFAALFESTVVADFTMSEWLAAERTRQIGKSMSNAIGDFHQALIGHLPGWSSTGAAGGRVDLIHPKPFGPRQTGVVAEVKNKHNTMNSNSQKALFQTFQEVLGEKQFKHYTAYLIEVIPKKLGASDSQWVISKYPALTEVRKISAREVYSLSTGVPDAIDRLFDAIPKVLEDLGIKTTALQLALTSGDFSRLLRDNV